MPPRPVPLGLEADSELLAADLGEAEESVRIAPVGAASASSRLTLWKPRIACSAGTSPLLQAGSLSMPGTADQRQAACRPDP